MNIPDSIKKILPDAGVKYFKAAYDSALARNHSDANAFKIAWGVTRKKLRKDSNGMLVANSQDFIPRQLFIFAMEPSNEILITNSEDGDIIVDAVLADTTPRKSDGKRFSDEALQQIAEQINAGGSTLPDTEHLVLNDVVQKHVGSIEAIKAEIQRQKGLFTKIKAAVKEGKLWIRAWLDKRYRKIVDKYKFLSIEASAKEGPDGTLLDPKYLGFTFTHTPQLIGAAVAE